MQLDEEGMSGDRERMKEQERECVSEKVCVCVRERERQRARERVCVREKENEEGMSLEAFFCVYPPSEGCIPRLGRSIHSTNLYQIRF